ncbi:DUF2493 domain-containing protein [Chroococcidiopsis sp.]|uniref:DUF2493 domain-containing protein n=1 Tax=Chroococcidiopsis sp. TaxID=3088168 RepID=UPI003F39F401
MIKVVVAGSRSFSNYPVAKFYLDLALINHTDVEIVSGTARGADQLGERYAKEKGFPVKLYPAEWDMYGKSAGYIRNEKMAKYVSHAVIFWDGKSKGTKHMIDL